jgi:DNA-binding NtrC family response regulator
VTAGKKTLGRILVVEDDPILLDQLTWALKGEFEVAGAGDAETAHRLLASDPDLCLFDLRLPPSAEVQEGLDLLAEARRRNPDATVVMMSGEADHAVALRSIALGAFDFFRKPLDPAEVLVILRRALERRRLVAENRELKESVRSDKTFDRLLGESPGMQRLFKDIERVAPSDASVLILGESGTGKDLVAHSIHERSPRKSHPFVAVNASAFPDTLAESELFGHERGAFTGAVASRVGRFELAQGGTIFLDEVGTLSPAVQAKLLRVLETHEVVRVGGTRTLAVDFRLISATNEDLEARVAAGAFREDLFYRINTVSLTIPPLRERSGDVSLLAEHFLAKFAGRHRVPEKELSKAVRDRLEAHPWRGNVRELEHAIEMLVLFSDGETIGEEDLPRALRSSPSPSSAAPPPESFAAAVQEFERRLLAESIAEAGGIKAEAARRLKLDPNQIKYLCRKYGL